MKVDVYKVRVRFERLFADPTIFEGMSNLVQSYFLFHGTSKEKAECLRRSSGEISPTDDKGRPSQVSGTAKYRYQRKRVQSEFMTRANLSIEYADFGSGLSPDDHEVLWRKGRWGEMRFETKDFEHEAVGFELPDIGELYGMLRSQANPTTLATVELTNVPERFFPATVSYLQNSLAKLAQRETATVEVYAAGNLSVEERRALEKRLARASTDSTVFVIVSKTGTLAA